MGRDRTEELKAIYEAALRSADPGEMVVKHLQVRSHTLEVTTSPHTGGRPARVQSHFAVDLDGYDRLLVIGAGKAAARMAAGVRAVLGDRVTGGVIAVNAPHRELVGPIRTVVAGHPVPNASSVEAAAQILEMAEAADSRTLFVNVISGGGSALLCAPLVSNDIRLTLSEKQAVTRLLLGCGASIQEVNCVRKHLSAVKGGRLAEKMHPATSINLVLSDVVGDDLASIASGLLVPDPTTYADAIAVLRRYRVEDRIPTTAARILHGGFDGVVPETPKPGNTAFAAAHTFVIGSNRLALQAARQAAERLGYKTMVLSSRVTGEAREIAKMYAGIAKDALEHHLLSAAPFCAIAGGETTVTVRGSGTGGRNQELALSFLREMLHWDFDRKEVYFLSAGTDGLDGPTNAAGAIVTPTVISQSASGDLDPGEYLDSNDSYGFFARTGGLLVTGPTGTNVCDIQVLVVPK